MVGAAAASNHSLERDAPAAHHLNGVLVGAPPTPEAADDAPSDVEVVRRGADLDPVLGPGLHLDALDGAAAVAPVEADRIAAAPAPHRDLQKSEPEGLRVAAAAERLVAEDDGPRRGAGGDARAHEEGGEHDRRGRSPRTPAESGVSALSSCHRGRGPTLGASADRAETSSAPGGAPRHRHHASDDRPSTRTAGRTCPRSRSCDRGRSRSAPGRAPGRRTPCRVGRLAPGAYPARAPRKACRDRHRPRARPTSRRRGGSRVRRPRAGDRPRAPPTTTSLPLPAQSRSRPPKPQMTSRPGVPLKVLARPLPTTVHLSRLPFTRTKRSRGPEQVTRAERHLASLRPYGTLVPPLDVRPRRDAAPGRR